MGIEQQQVAIHWNYFLSIDEDLSKLSRYIEFNKSNFKCYSLEIARLLMTTSAEVDVIAKLVCKNINPNSTADNIHDYQREILPVFHHLPNSKVLLPRFGLKLNPWQNWETERNAPLWWKANNSVKHRRSESFHEANLKHLLNAVAGLFLMLILYYKDELRLLEPKPTLFIPGQRSYLVGPDWVFMNFD